MGSADRNLMGKVGKAGKALLGLLLATSALIGLPAVPAEAFSNNIITTYASNPTAQFSWPTDVTVSPSGEVFASSWSDGKGVHKVAGDGSTTTVVGNG